MIACDSCKNVNKKACEFRFVLARVVAGQQRASQVTVDSAPAELCDECAKTLFDRVRAVLPNTQIPSGGSDS